MSSNYKSSGELSQILTEYCNGSFPDIENVKNELLSSITDSRGDTVLNCSLEIFYLHTKDCWMCVYHNALAPKSKN